VGNERNKERDYPKTAISLATVGLKKPFSLLVSLIPHIIVLAALYGTPCDLLNSKD
jgi:hypothetical protein